MRKRAGDVRIGDVVCLPNYQVITVTRTWTGWTKLYGATVELHYVAEDGFPTYVVQPKRRSLAVRSPEVAL